MCGVYYSIIHTTHPDLVCLLFVPSLYSTFIYLYFIVSYNHMHYYVLFHIRKCMYMQKNMAGLQNDNLIINLYNSK